MYLIPLLATLMSSVFCGGFPLIARNLGHRGVTVFSIFSLTVAFLSSALIWVDLYIGGSPVWLDLFGPWIEVGTVSVSWVFYYDLLTAHMLFTVTSVSLAVHIYATVYMRSDPHLSLFMSYLSLFTFFMLVYVCSDNLLGMLVGWEGIQTQCLNGCNFILLSGFIAIKPQYKSDSFLFHQIVTGLLLGDGWFENRKGSVRLGISQTEKFKDVVQFIKILLYSLDYVNSYELKSPLTRNKSKPYYQIRTTTCSSLNALDALWYKAIKEENKHRRVKMVPSYIENTLTPLALALWIMGDGSGMRDGGFKLSTHSFSKEENLYLANLLHQLYALELSVLHERKKNLYYIRIYKRSVPTLFTIVKPFLQDSCLYKFRHVNIFKKDLEFKNKPGP